MTWLFTLVLLLVAVTACAQPDIPGGFRLEGNSMSTAPLTVTKSGNGTGTVSGPGINCGRDCNDAYALNSFVTLIATATGNSTFVGWSGACSGTSTCLVQMSQTQAVVASFIASGLQLAWDDNSSNETSFSLERRSPCTTGTFAVIASPVSDATTYIDTTADSITQYEYRIRAVNSNGNSAYSNLLCNDTTPPSDPGQPVIGSPSLGASTATFGVTWAASIDLPFGLSVTRYDWTAGYNDTTYTTSGMVSTNALSLPMPYPSSGTRASTVCVRAVDSVGYQSGQVCNSFTTPAAPVVVQTALVGVLRYDAWHPGTTEVDGQQLGPAQWRYRLPFFGTETGPDTVTMNEATQIVIDQEIAYAKAAGIDYFIFGHNNGGIPEQSLYISSTHKGDGVNFAFAMAAMTSFRIPNAVSRIAADLAVYQTVQGGRPVIHGLSWYWPNNDAGGDANRPVSKADVDSFRAQMVTAIGQNPYIVCMNFSAGQAAADADFYGCDAIGTYLYTGGASSVGDAFSTLLPTVEVGWDLYKNTGHQVVPFVMTGYDPRPWQGLSYTPWWTYATPAEIATHLQHALTWVTNNPTAAPGLITIYAWNELGEGGWLVPSNTLHNPVGNGRLDAIQGVLNP